MQSIFGYVVVKRIILYMIDSDFLGNPEPFCMSWSVPFFLDSSSSVSEHQNYRISKEEWLSTKKVS